MVGWLVGFYAISAPVGYLMQNSAHIYIVNKLELICTQLSIAIVCTKLDGFKYSTQTLIILFNINHLFANN